MKIEFTREVTSRVLVVAAVAVLAVVVLVDVDLNLKRERTQREAVMPCIIKSSTRLTSNCRFSI